MDGEVVMHQPEVPAPTNLRRRPLVALVVIAVILVVAIIWVGNWALKQQTTAPAGPAGLTHAQKTEIL